MSDYKTERFELTIPAGLGGHTTFTLKSIGSLESLKADRRKIYIVKDGEDFLYVGEANTSIRTRFQRSFTSYRFFIKNKKARGGYKGYKWIGHYAAKKDHLLTIYVTIFDKTHDDNRKFVEAVEGELVFLIRKSTGKWPHFQNEIHFSNDETAENVAIQIFDNAKHASP